MSESDKLDLKKVHKALYGPSAANCSIVEVPPLNILCVEGAGDPNSSQEYSDAVSALFTVSWTLKFMLKQRPGLPDYSVMPLESLWWSEDDQRFDARDKSAWQWRALIVQPDFVTSEFVSDAVDKARGKKPLAALEILRLERFDEGTAAQIMHIGAWADEQPTIERLHAFIADRGYARVGRHHEIYLSDPARTAVDKLKTVIRQPVQKQSGTGK